MKNTFIFISYLVEAALYVFSLYLMGSLRAQVMGSSVSMFLLQCVFQVPLCLIAIQMRRLRKMLCDKPKKSSFANNPYIGLLICALIIFCLEIYFHMEERRFRHFVESVEYIPSYANRKPPFHSNALIYENGIFTATD